MTRLREKYEMSLYNQPVLMWIITLWYFCINGSSVCKHKTNYIVKMAYIKKE